MYEKKSIRGEKSKNTLQNLVHSINLSLSEL